jgi:hypothetical protein
VIKATPISDMNRITDYKVYRRIKMPRYLHIKQISLSLLVLLFFSAFFPGASLAAEGKELTIIYTGSVRGNFEPCHS